MPYFAPFSAGEYLDSMKRRLQIAVEDDDQKLIPYLEKEVEHMENIVKKHGRYCMVNW